METFSVLLAICAGNSPVPGEFPTQRPVTRSFDVYFDLRPNKRLSKQSLGWWFEPLSPPLWRHRNDMGRLLSGSLRILTALPHWTSNLISSYQGSAVRVPVYNKITKTHKTPHSSPLRSLGKSNHSSLTQFTILERHFSEQLPSSL